MQQACEADGSFGSIPESIWVALLHNYAREITDDEKYGKNWDIFFHVICPWKMPAAGADSDGDSRKLTQPRARSLLMEPREVVVISDRCFCEKLVALLRGGSKKVEAVRSFCINLLTFLELPQHAISEEASVEATGIFTKWMQEHTCIAKAVLAASGYGSPGEFETSVVNKMMQAAKESTQCSSAVIQSAMQTNGHWQARDLLWDHLSLS